MRSTTLSLGLLALLLVGCEPIEVFRYPVPDAVTPPPPDIDTDNDGVPTSTDCDDADPAVGAADVWYLDGDNDGHGGPNGALACSPGFSGGPWVDVPGDCDDSDASVYPGAPETCNGINDDCDLVTDEGFDQDADGFRTCDQDCDDTNATAFPGALETCDGVDESCDGEIDEGVLLTFFGDWDGDGYGDAEVLAFACSAPAGFLSDSSDCDDADFDVHPAASEVCDGIDNDCDADIDDTDGSLDLSTRSAFYADNDGDGWGEPGSMMVCTAPPGTVTNNTDCNDSDPATYPSAPETCDGADNDCDDTYDENLFSEWYADADGDGFGAGSVIAVICGGSTGSLADNNIDCDDDESFASPGFVEICDGIDNDCDGDVDELEGNPDVQTLWDDDDGDGFGDDAGSFVACPADGWVLQGGDCDDSEPLANPSQIEVDADGIDNDCDGGIDNGGAYCCLDDDGDGFGDGTMCQYETTGVCDPDYVVGDGDCNDANFSYHPLALDILGDGLDTDCDNTDE